MERKGMLQELFYNYPSKQWHFEELLKETKMTRPRLAYWLKHYQQQGILQRFKPRGRMPYYTGNFQSSAYKNSKKIYALQQFQHTGFLEHLEQLPYAKTVILFGSFSRADWHKESDLDIFIYGTPQKFQQGAYEKKMKREIQIFTCKTKEELEQYSQGLLKNIMKGSIIKGTVDFLKVIPS